MERDVPDAALPVQSPVSILLGLSVTSLQENKFKYNVHVKRNITSSVLPQL